MQHHKNRKKQLRLQAKKKISTHLIHDPERILFYKIKCHYLAVTDEFICELDCVINNKRLAIKGIVNPEKLAGEGVLLEVPRQLRAPQYNCTEISIAKQAAPHFYNLVQTYVYTIGDRLDANLSHNIDLHFENKIGLNDESLKNEKEDFVNVYKVKEEN